jgi:hypothetical protein
MNEDTIGQSVSSSISNDAAKQTYIKFDKEGRVQRSNMKSFQKKRTANLQPLELQESNSSDDFDSELLEAARAIIHEAGATPLMDIVDKIHALHGEFLIP